MEYSEDKCRDKVAPVFNQALCHEDVWGSGDVQVHAYLTLELDEDEGPVLCLCPWYPYDSRFIVTQN
jgi:hypothetical protein